MNSFSSISKAKIQNLAKLTQKKFRESEKKFLIEGEHLLVEALNSDWKIEEVLVTSDFLLKKEATNLLKQCHKQEIRIYQIAESDLKKLADTIHSQGVIGVISIKDYGLEHISLSKKNRHVIVAIEEIIDPGNLGTIIRTCDWFGVDAVICGTNSVEVFNPKVIRSTMGSLFHIPVYTDVDLHSFLVEIKEFDFKVITTVLEKGKMVDTYQFPQNIVIVMGNEVRGVAPEIQSLADESITIRRYGKAESLNVAIACGVVLGAIRSSD